MQENLENTLTPNQAIINYWHERGYEQIKRKDKSPIIIEGCYVLKNRKGERIYYNYQTGAYMTKEIMLHHLEKDRKHQTLKEIINSFKFLGLQDDGEKQIALYNCKHCHSTVSLIHLRKHHKEEDNG